MFLFVAATNAAGRFFRAGMEFTTSGRILNAKRLPEDVLRRLDTEPNLKVRAATPDEARPMVLDTLLALIPQLGPDAFGKDGKPNLKTLREEAGFGNLVTDEVRDEAMAALAAQGFEAPKAQPKG